MIKLNKRKIRDHSEARNKVARSVAANIIKAQHIWATWMNRQSQRCPPKLRSALMIIFLMAMAAVSFSMIVGGFDRNPRVIADAGAIKMPKVTQHQKSGVTDSATDGALKRIKRVRRYLDSLAATKDGKIKLDNIISLRPGLQDSIKLVEQLYKNR
ncbi:MAG: hypothetical protein LBF27_13945 [Sphingobacterium sp.]|jgi:hypothetical protein|nr:hypothetical protein [Sphingobacterium sp.]